MIFTLVPGGRAPSASAQLIDRAPVNRAQAVAAVLAAMVLVVLDAGVANVALPTIATALRVAPGQSIWVVTAYQVALVMGLLPCAALGESLGNRRVFMSGVAVFTAAATLCAWAPSLPWLVAARFLQGLGGAAVMALGMALLRAVVAPRQLGAAIGWNALAVALASAAGPTVGSVILSIAQWRWLFAFHLPLGAAVLLASLALPARGGSARPLDLLSIALTASVFASIVVGAELVFANPLIAALLVGLASVSLLILLRRELPKVAPMIPLDLLKAHSFRSSVLASMFFFAGASAGLMALPFYLHHGLGQNALMTGLYMTPWPLAVAVAGPLAGRVADRISTAWLCATGGTLLAAGLAAASLWPLQGNPQPLIAIGVVCGLGFGLFQVPNNRNLLLSAPLARSGAAGGMQGTARLVGQTAGAVITSLLYSVASAGAAPRVGLAIGALLVVAAACISLARSREKAS